MHQEGQNTHIDGDYQMETTVNHKEEHGGGGFLEQGNIKTFFCEWTNT